MANIDKVELEKKIDSYLEREIPLSYLMEEQKLSYPQMKLLINRAISYNRKAESLNNNYPNASYDNISQDFIAVPHEMQEEYPFLNDEQIALFKRLKELQEKEPSITRDLFKTIDNEIHALEEQIKSYNPNDIARGEKVAIELDSMRANDDSIEDILRRNYLTTVDFMQLDKIFTSYLEKQQELELLKEKRKEAESEYKQSKRRQREIEDIREQLVTHNIKLVNFCIRYFFKGIPVDQQEIQLYGLEGLARAINGFDPSLGFQFSTYAVPTIVHTIERNFESLYPGYNWQDYCRKELINYYRDMYKKEANDETLEISARTLAETGLVSLTEKAIINNDKLIDRVAPLSDVQTPYEDESEFGKRKFPATFDEYDSLDKYTDETELGLDAMEDEIFTKYVHEELTKILSELKPNESQAIIMRYGLEDGVFKTYAQVGKILNLSRSRVREIVLHGFRSLRHPVRYRKVRGLLDIIKEVENIQDLEEFASIGISRKH